MTTFCKNVQRNAGFTLAEMLVVLAILAITTTIAVQSLVPVANQARVQTTQQTLTSTRNSIISTQISPDGTIAVSGLLADTGIIPFGSDASLLNAVNNNTSLYPAQVWGISFMPTTGVPTAFPMTSPGSYTIDTEIVAGWNGPYMRPATGFAQIVDGWGNAIYFPATLASDGSYTFGSAGPDGQLNTPDDIQSILYLTDYSVTSLVISLSEGFSSAGSYAVRTATLQSAEQSFWLVIFNLSAGTGEPAALNGGSAVGPFLTSNQSGSGGTAQSALPLALPNSQVSLLQAGTVAIRAFTSSSNSNLTHATLMRSSQPVVITLSPRAAAMKTLLFP